MWAFEPPSYTLPSAEESASENGPESSSSRPQTPPVLVPWEQDGLPQLGPQETPPPRHFFLSTELSLLRMDGLGIRLAHAEIARLAALHHTLAERALFWEQAAHSQYPPFYR